MNRCTSLRELAAARLALAVLLAGASSASFSQDKLNMLLILGNGAASEFTQKAVLRDPKVTGLIAEDFSVRTFPAERLDLRYYAIRQLPAVLIFGNDGSIHRHEGAFSGPSNFIRFALAAKRGMAEPDLRADSASVGITSAPTDSNNSAGE